MIRRRHVKTAVLVFAVAVASWSEDAHGQDSNRPRGPKGRRTEILQRLDANGDGILQPDEIPDRAKPLLRRAAERSGLKPGEPIALNRLIGQPLQKEVPPDQPERQHAADPPVPSQPTGREITGHTGADPTTGQSAAVLGFGEEPRFPPVPGFDVSLETGKAVTRSTDPTSAGTVSGSARATAPRQADDARKNSLAKKSIVKKTRKYARSLIKKYDKNKDGVLQQEEIQDVRFDVRKADRNSDGNITLDELATSLMDESTDGGGSGQAGGKRSPPRANETGSQSQRDDETKARSPDGSDRRHNRSDRDRKKQSDRRRRWFDKYDRDRDGQVAMSEFSSTWSVSKVAEFERLDANGDGLVTREEAE